MQPRTRTDDAAIKKFEDLLAKVQAEDKDNTFFINSLKDSITILNVKQKGQKMSQDYIDQNKASQKPARNPLTTEFNKAQEGLSKAWDSTANLHHSPSEGKITDMD